ncbi:uncharacterized protein LOC105425045 isoform X2 [Pogonomyrmex barbatus]|uniref:Uncharacterized protein LOC105425045 isoform X2 n=1 Tax=Pogonomyrmex barbatus TaxID=144034 RepID=A0A6I9W5T6_9HYME|nr:uncharacterized protein LOC105425045 isoform X2 [Pogonomyrmex barbatus]
MVMAGNENVPGALADDTLSVRLQWLRQRREALQEKLAQKNNELKNLCIEEAEITGILSPDIPLEPGESPPSFHRKVDTCFIYPQKLINKLKTTDVEESELELEKQVQLGIVETALIIINDPTESKATRRKHRLAYQQSQRRLQELEMELNFIRQTRGKVHRLQSSGSCNTQSHSHINVKHRIKKPRPPLDSTGNDIITPKSVGRSILHEPGVNLSPLGSEDKLNSYTGQEYEKQLVVSNVCNHHNSTYLNANPVEQSSVKIVEHDHNDNHNIYILPDQYRVRTYSHGSGESRGHYQDIEKTYHPYVPNTYTEDERQIRYRQFQHLQKQQQLQDQIQQNHRLQYTSSFEYKRLDNTDIRKSCQAIYDRDFRASHCLPDYQTCKNGAQSQLLLQRRDRDSPLSFCIKNSQHSGGSTSIEAQLSSGYWARHNDDIYWVSMDEPDRFGSLDRRRRNAQHNDRISEANLDTQSRYRMVTVAYNKSTSSSNVTTLSNQHHSIHLLPLSEQIPLINSKMLLRTQSLGSVETWQSSHSYDSHNCKDAPVPEYTTNNNRKNRQKEWYETSLDMETNADLDHNLAIARKNAHYQSSPPLTCIKTTKNARDNQIISESLPMPMNPMNSHKRDKSEKRQYAIQQSHFRYDQSTMRPKVLEIPAESKPSLDVCDNAIQPLGSSQNCTVVQPGKYQPYREVTKPFEMSDFYKYSTKFRKRNESVMQSQLENRDSSLQDNRSVEVDINDLSRDSNSFNFEQNGSVGNVIANPVQRRLYQPVQRMTCQPYLSSLR